MKAASVIKTLRKHLLNLEINVTDHNTINLKINATDHNTITVRGKGVKRGKETTSTGKRGW